ncbi:MAG TPA: diguanylate cyclase [Rugosibacter sp.]
MKYNHSKTESAEYLRLALPLMSKHDAPLHPISYAVWYEYVSGINRSLNAAVDALSARDIPLTGEEIETLFNQHVVDITTESALSISQEIQHIIGGITVSTGEVAKEAGYFGKTLLDIEKNSALPGATIDFKALIASTQAMQASINSLKAKLAESQREIESLREEVTRVRNASLRDALTGLTNRYGFDQALNACLDSLHAEDAHDPAALPCLLMCDIDHFKIVNDTYGHLFGDKVIRAVAQVLTDNVKGRDTAARYGGEEFVVLLPGTPLEGAHALAEKLRSIIEGGRVKRGGSEELAKVTISLGVSRYVASESGTSFIERTDKALYAAKQAGRNQVSLAAT